MSDQEVIARALAEHHWRRNGKKPLFVWEEESEEVHAYWLGQANVSMAAVAAARRLTAEGMVAVRADRWDRVTTFALAAAKYLQVPTDGPLSLSWTNHVTGERIDMTIEPGDFD